MDNKDFLYKFFGLKKVFQLVKDNWKATNKIRLKKDKTTSENFRTAGNKFYTQENHDLNVHRDTLIQYTKSIAFAPQDSEELALGLSNRSALLLHLHRYKECLIDIDRALEITKSDQLKSKLLSRKEKCLSIHDNATEKSVEESVGKLNIENDGLELPDIVTSKKIPCAAECVTIKSNNTHKRQLTATRDIKPGEIIIVEKAYACSPTNTEIYLNCSHCLNFAWNGIPCDSCVNSIYCSETCKTEAWLEYHAYECSMLPSIISFFGQSNTSELDSTDPILTILLARIFIKAVKAEGFESIMNETELIDDGKLDSFSDGAFHSNKFGYVYSLRSRPQKKIRNFKECTNGALVMYLLIKHTNLIPVANKLKNCTSTDEKLLVRLRDILRKLLSIVELNVMKYGACKYYHTESFVCSDKCISPKGVFIVPCSNIINHSCVPYVCKSVLPQPKITIFATKPIKKGEQLFLSYGPGFFMDVTARQRYLKEYTYYFCRCLACTNNQLFKKINMETGYSKYIKVRMEFEQIFGGDTHIHNMDFFNHPNNSSKWNILTRESLDQALKLIELYFKYFEYDEACMVTLKLDTFINGVFCKLYGERRGDRCVMLTHC